MLALLPAVVRVRSRLDGFCESWAAAYTASQSRVPPPTAAADDFHVHKPRVARTAAPLFVDLPGGCVCSPGPAALVAARAPSGLASFPFLDTFKVLKPRGIFAGVHTVLSEASLRREVTSRLKTIPNYSLRVWEVDMNFI